MANLKSIAYKLQKALMQKGRYITISQMQNYSNNIEAMVTIYVLREKRMVEGKIKNVVLLETYKMIDVVNCLVNILNGGG